jgi:hypothetical protein
MIARFLNWWYGGVWLVYGHPAAMSEPYPDTRGSQIIEGRR